MRSVAVVSIVSCVFLAGGAAADPRAADGKSVAVPPFVAVAGVSATSFLANKKEPERYAARQALVSAVDGPRDGDDGPESYSSMWCEGRPDEGLGETLTITLTQPTRVDALEIAAGVWKSERLFARNNLPTRLEVSIDGGAPQTVVVPPTRERLSIAIGKPIRAIAIKIAAVKKGIINDSCLSSVALQRDGRPMAPLFGLAPPAVAALPGAIARIVTAVGANDAATLAAVVDLPLTVETVDRCGEVDSTTSMVVHRTAKAMQRDCRLYREQAEAHRSDPCPADAEPLSLENSDGAIDVLLCSMCGGRFNPVFRLVWRASTWKLSAIGARMAQ